MWRRAWLLAGLPLLAAAALAGLLFLSPAPARTAARAAAPLAPRKLRAPKAERVRPRAFASCAGLIAYARQHFATTHGVPDPAIQPVSEPVPTRAPGAPAPATSAPAQGGATNGTTSTSYSTTNVQEAGVDEPDIVKTNGSTIFTVSQNTLYAVAAGGGTAGAPRLLGSLPLGSTGYGAQLLLQGQRLLVISGGGPVPVPLGVAGPARPGGGARPAIASPAIVSPYYYGGKTVLTEVDIHNPSAMKVTQTLSVDGTFVDARQNSAIARVVISSAPRAIATAGLRASASGWVPSRQFRDVSSGGHSVRPVAPCSTIRRPVQFSGLGMLTILTINLDTGLSSAHSDSLMADAEVVYGSQTSLYVATHKWINPQIAPLQVPVSQTTVIDRFDATHPDRTTFVAAGEVPGFLLNQFSLSENNGYLRVASTSRPIWWGGGPVLAAGPRQSGRATPPRSPGPGASPRQSGGATPPRSPGARPRQAPSPGPPRPVPPQPPSQSFVTVLATRGGVLVPVGQVAGLGLGQQIYSVRFVGDTGYVVTFHQVDPLYTIDLSSPIAPRVAGQLELQGYSAYLHPVGNGLLLGIGQDVGSANNEPAGTQLELFDVSKASAPKLLARTTVGTGSSSQVQYDHHAFLFWPPTNLAVLPVQIYPVYSGPQPAPAGGQTGASQGSATASTGSATASQGSTTSSNPGFTGAIGFRVDRSGIAEVGRISHDATNGYTPAIRRSIVIGDALFTVSDGGVMASRLDTLAREAFVPFPQPQPQPGYGGSTGPPTASPGSAPAH